MKRGILFVTLGVTLAGVASANVFTTSSPAVTAPSQLRDSVPAVNSLVPPEQPAKSANAAAPAPVVKKASVEPRQAPVPLQVKQRPPVNLPPVDPMTGEAKSTDSGSTQEAASNDAFNEKAAKAAIEADGYKGVTVLRKGVNGVWHASALRGRTTVMLTVDASGAVSAD